MSTLSKASGKTRKIRAKASEKISAGSVAQQESSAGSGVDISTGMNQVNVDTLLMPVEAVNETSEAETALAGARSVSGKKSKKSAPSTKEKQTVVAKPADVSAEDRQLAAEISIYQIYFKPEQLDNLDPGFIPFDNSASTDLLREFTVFEQIAGASEPVGKYWGALSWRFEEKTGLTGAELIRQVKDLPDHDLYYCNPYPENEAIYLNGWQQGSISHPALIELSAAIFAAAGLDKRDLHSVQPSVAFSACNYFVGNAKFWSRYVPWVRNVIDAARATMPGPVLQVLDSALGDPINRHVNASYWPFIIERLLPLFMRTVGHDLKVCKLKLEKPESRLNQHLQRLREMKDMACRTRSRWLYNCWLGYRNLYLMQTCSREWCQRHLPTLTNGEAEFW